MFSLPRLLAVCDFTYFLLTRTFLSLLSADNKILASKLVPLVLDVYVRTFVEDGRLDADYYVTRLEGDYYDVSITCHITYKNLYSVNIRDNNRYNVKSRIKSKELKVRDEYWIIGYIWEDMTLPTRIIRIYFDFD